MEKGMEVPSKAENAIELLYDPESPLWSIYLEKTIIQKDTHIPVFIPNSLPIQDCQKPLSRVACAIK